MAHNFVRVAHRGASASYPENTLLAFRKAMETGVDALELDVHRTQDDQLVVIHDSKLDRTTTGQGRVREHTLSQVRSYDAGQGEKVPTLAEVVQLVAGTPVRLCVEIKGFSKEEELALTEPVMQFLNEANMIDKVIVTSFLPAVLLKAKAINPLVSLMLDPWPQDGSLTPRQVVEQTLASGANGVSFECAAVTRALADECRLMALTLWPWVPRKPEEFRAMLELGVSGIVTDSPDVLNKVLNDPSF
jgi:glycerophosphoryl diester phosphodiesterase